MVKTKRIDVKANAEVEAKLRKDQKELTDGAIDQMKHFIAELAAGTGKKFSLHWADSTAGIVEIAARDIKLVSLWRRKKIGSIYFRGKERNTKVDSVTITLTDESLDVEFSKQVELFEKKLKNDGLLPEYSNIKYTKHF